MTQSAEPPSAPARTVVLEATDPPDVDWASARLWRVLVTFAGVPVSSLWVPAPGRLDRPAAFTRALTADGVLAADYWAAYERYRRRMGLADRAFRRPTVSVVVCTHGRSAYLPGLLAAVEALDPAPDEVIVVDNAPGERDSRAVIEAAGARYVREDRKGLDHARTAGVRAATGELVAFTDDDCIPAPRWLADVGELFDDPAVAAVTGPAFAYEIESPAQLRFELEGGFSRGLRRRVWDWTAISPLDAGAVGAGANMIFRRAVLEAIGDPFPAELDAGTPTESGGDMYAIYKALDAGHRVTYDPGTYVFHRHRRDPASLHRAFWGYGVGLSAVMAKLLVEERELAAPRTWAWLWSQYRTMLLRRLAGTADPRSLRVAWDYLRGGFVGPVAWARARRAIAPAPLVAGARPAADPDPPDDQPPAGGTTVSVVIPTVDRPGALRRCLAALAPDAAGGGVEIIVVDDGPAAAVPERGAGPVDYRIVRSGGRGAAAARNLGAREAAGDLLLFLDDDLVPAPLLVARHRARHAAEGPDTIVIGYSPPAPPRPGFSELAAALWWHEHFDLLADTADLTFADMLSGNMSIGREAFLALGGFDEGLGRMRREDWLLGHDALSAGARLVYERAAVAAHEFSLPTRRRIAAAREEGHGDALLGAGRPELADALATVYAVRGVRRRALGRVLEAVVPRAAAPLATVLDVLERARLRRSWLRLFQIVQWSSYAAGRREGERAAGRPPRSPARPPVVRAGDTTPLPHPGVCARPFDLSVRAGSRPRRITPDLGRWNRLVAHDAAAAELAAAPRPHPAQAPAQSPASVLLLGPAHPPGAERLLPTGARRVAGDPSRHWEVIGAAIAELDAERAVVPMPDIVATPAWLARVMDSVDGDRIAVVLGHDPRRRDAEHAPYVTERSLSPERYATRDDPFHYVVVHRERFLELGGFTAGLDALGSYAPPLELAERALDAGLIVMHQRVGGLRVPPKPLIPFRRREWQRQRARGALLAREGMAAAARGAIPLAADVARRGVPLLPGAGRLTAYAVGALSARQL